MPALIVNRRPGKKRKKPPCGRIMDTGEPFSPFQLLIDQRRSALGLSTRELARRMSEIVTTSQSTLWMWLHTANGFPSKKSLRPRHIEAFAKVLKLKPDAIKDAIDASRPIFRPGSLPPSAPSMDGLKSLIEILENDKRHVVPRTFIINLAKNLHNGLTHSQDSHRR